MRRNSRIIITGTVLILLLTCLILPVSSLSARYVISEDGTIYRAEVEIAEQDHYNFYEVGILGERIPVTASNISLLYNGKEAPFEKTREGISFQKGNYTLVYDRPVKTNQIQEQYDSPRTSTVIIPSAFRIDNPLLAVISPSSYSIQQFNNTTNVSVVSWKESQFIQVKYYDSKQVQALWAFAQFWIIIAIVLLLPYYLTNSSRGLKPPENE